ncbi:MAG: glycosyltransferase family 87 protein [Actinobacteria bacterium]|nr:glycosyltransferase family 87 protein [Actinomycetota bacterium]
MPPQTPADPPQPSRLAWPTRRTICILLLILAAVLAANFWVGILRNTFNDLSSAVGVPQHDFYQYYAGGHNWNLGLDPYRNYPDDTRVIHQPRFNYPQISGYIYPPTVLPLLGQLARHDYDWARTAWLALDVTVFSLMVLVAVVVSRGRRLEVLTAAVLLTMVSFAFFYHIHEGQIDMIVAGLSISAFLLYPRWGGWPSAALLAIAVATKVTPILLVAVMVVYFRDWRLILKMLACGVVVFAVSLAFVDFSLYREYVFKILPTIAGSDSSPFNQTPLRFWWRYPMAIKVGSALGYAALLFIAWVAGRNTRRLPEAERRVDVGTERNAILLMTVLLMLLFSPLAWQMAYVWVIVPLALVLVSPPPRDKEWVLLVLGAAAALLSMRMWPYRVLDMTNIIGGGIAALCLMRYYLPLETSKAPLQAGGSAPRKPLADGEREQADPG